MSLGWQNFLLCMGLHLCFPLLPLLVELWATNGVTEKTMTLAGAMYTISIGVTSRNRAIFGLAILCSIVLAVAFGFAASENDPLPVSGYVSGVIILVTLASHAVERYHWHVVEGRSFLRFDGEGD